MQSKAFQPICLAVLVALVLLIGATPVSALASNVADSCHSSVSQATAPPSSCCITPDCPLSHSVPVSVATSTTTSTPSRVNPVAAVPAGVTAGSSFRQNLPQFRDAGQALAPSLGAQVRCRNSLSSEEPPLA